MPKKKLDKIKELEKKLINEGRHVYDVLTSIEKKSMESLGKSYKKFLTDCKTEREAAARIAKNALNAGYVRTPTKSKKRKIFS